MRNFISQAYSAVKAYPHVTFWPLLATLRGYPQGALKRDVWAGVNVALLAFPQGMAYALIAGLPIQYGIYGSAVAAIAGALFLQRPFVVLGPTNATSIILLSAFASLGISGADKLLVLPVVLITVGAMLIIGSYLRLARLTQYISRSVITGYITAAAVLIIVNQTRNVFGLEFSGHPSSFFDVIGVTISHLTRYDWQTRWPVLTVAAFTLVSYLLLQRRMPKLPNVALTLVLSGTLAVVMLRFNVRFPQSAFLAAVQPGSWHLTVPVIDMQTLGRLSTPALALALLAVLEGTSVGKTLAARAGRRFNPDQAMFSIGMANIGCGLFSGMPASGSLTRSMVNFTGGAVTPISGLVNGAICAVGALLLGPAIAFVPRAALAVLVIIIGISLITPQTIKIVVRSTHSDAVVFFTTFISGLLFSLEAAVFFGVTLSIALFLRKVGVPETVEYEFNREGQLAALEGDQSRRDPEVSIVHVEGSLFFGASELFRDQVRRACSDADLKIVILKMRNAHHLDATGVMALEELIGFLHKNDRALLISEVRKNTIRIFKRSGLLARMSRENIFPDVPSNPNLSTARALKRAQDIIGDSNVRVSIYIDEIKERSGEKQAPVQAEA